MINKKILLALTLILGLTGCGKDSNLSIEDYGSKGETDKSTAETTEITVAATENELNQAFDASEAMTGIDKNGIPKHIKCNLGKDYKNLEIDADVSAIGYDDVKIYKANETYIDEDYLANLAENLFDQGKYQVRLPYLYWDSDTRDREETHLQEMEDADHHIDHSRMLAVGSALGVSKPKEDPGFIGTRSILRETTNDGLCDNFNCTHQFTIMTGKINGVDHELSYIHCSSITGETSSLTLSPCVPIPDLQDLGVPDLAPNIIDSNQAQQNMQELLNRTGFEDYHLSYYTDINCLNEATQSLYNCGYRMVFVPDSPDLEGTQTEEEGIVLYENEDPSQAKILPQSNIFVNFYDDSHLQIFFSINHSFGNVLYESPNMLSFDQILTAANDYVSNRKKTEGEDEYNTWLTDVIGINQVINKIHLSYIPIKYNDQLAYIPAWIFSYSNGTHLQGRDSFGVFAVSAIDGEIHPFANVYRQTLY